MTIKLTNGTELNPIAITGGNRFLQGANRDVLSFIFSEDTSMDEMDGLFVAENCETITIVEGEQEHIHKGYAIRAELKREPVEVTPATESSEAVYENRVIVSMAQRTYTETRMAYLEAQIAKIVG